MPTTAAGDSFSYRRIIIRELLTEAEKD